MTAAAAAGEQGTRSALHIMANIFISFIGAGVLGLPYAFRQAGLLQGIVLMLLVCALS
jgi:amino acid permease